MTTLQVDLVTLQVGPITPSPCGYLTEGPLDDLADL